MITAASINAMRRRAEENRLHPYQPKNTMRARLQQASDDVHRLCDEVERLRTQLKEKR